jgi:hypothetical protein
VGRFRRRHGCDALSSGATRGSTPPPLHRRLLLGLILLQATLVQFPKPAERSVDGILADANAIPSGYVAIPIVTKEKLCPSDPVILRLDNGEEIAAHMWSHSGCYGWGYDSTIMLPPKGAEVLRRAKKFTVIVNSTELPK